MGKRLASRCNKLRYASFKRKTKLNFAREYFIPLQYVLLSSAATSLRLKILLLKQQVCFTSRYPLV